jgi:hypothetical protein
VRRKPSAGPFRLLPLVLLLVRLSLLRSFALRSPSQSPFVFPPSLSCGSFELCSEFLNLSCLVIMVKAKEIDEQEFISDDVPRFLSSPFHSSPTSSSFLPPLPPSPRISRKRKRDSDQSSDNQSGEDTRRLTSRQRALKGSKGSPSSKRSPLFETTGILFSNDL